MQYNLYFNTATCVAQNLTNGQVKYSEPALTNGRYPVDTVTSYTCNYKYTYSGPVTRACETSGNWSFQNQSQSCNPSKLFYFKVI